MNEQQIKNILEGALLAVGRPLSLDELAGLFTEDECPERAALRQALESLQQDYAGRGFELKEVASGFRLQVKAELSPWISRLWVEKPSRYSRALLETLALVAYRQPITRGEIEDIRGVSVSSSIMKTLQEREWIRVVGHRDVPGRPAMYGTTKAFLDYFNLKSLDELPTLAELRDIDSINAELDLAMPDTAARPEQGDDEEAVSAGADEAGAVEENAQPSSEAEAQADGPDPEPEGSAAVIGEVDDRAETGSAAQPAGAGSGVEDSPAQTPDAAVPEGLAEQLRSEMDEAGADADRVEDQDADPRRLTESG